MPSGIDPALLMFAGRFLSQGGGDPSNGFGNALGAGLEAAGGQQLFRQEQERVRKADLVKNAESSISMRKAMQEIQAKEAQRNANKEFIGTLPEDQRAAAAVNPEQAALIETQQANPAPITPIQQEGLDRNDRDFAASQKQLGVENLRADQRFDLAVQELRQKSKPRSEDVSRLRKEYTASSGEFTAVRDGYRRVLATDKSAAGDLSLIFGFMKMLDPGSVVREAEFANAENTAGVPDRIRNLYNKVLSGERLNVNQRDQFKAQAESLYDVQRQTQIEQKSAYGEIASRAGINVLDVTQQVFAPSGDDLRSSQFDIRMGKLGIDLMSVDETAQRYNLTPEQVLDHLEAQP